MYFCTDFETSGIKKNKMKKQLVILLLSAMIMSCGIKSFSQTTEQLDEKYGWQNFKFNTSLNEYTKYNPVLITPGQYYLKDVSSLKIGDYDIERVELVFKDDKLVRVFITIDDLNRTKIDEILNALIKNYGRYTTFRSSSYPVMTSQMVWKGKKVSLTYSWSSYSEGEKYMTKIYLTYSKLDSTPANSLGSDL